MLIALSMIAWPAPDALSEGAKKALALFKKTGFSAELEQDTKKWRFRSWARSPEAPARMIVSTEAGDETRTFTLEMTGFWRRGE